MFMAMATRFPARFDQAEGFPAVRVFDKPDRPTAKIIGEIKSGTCGLAIQENVNSFHKVFQDGLEGWVGVKNVIFQEDLAEGHVAVPNNAVPSNETPMNKRIRQEVDELLALTLATDGMALQSSAEARSNPSSFKVLLKGPDNTRYFGSTFTIDVTVPADYPWSPPQLKFASPVAHPDVSNDGKICLASLFTHAEWTPAFGLRKSLLALIVFLSEPAMGAPGCHWKMLRPAESARALL
jgi:ubiquitin-protein ligase